MPQFEVVVVGAGFAGLQMLWTLRNLGMSALVIERGDDVGGTWYWNRYPGARCDVISMDYSVPWDPEMDQQWDWTERFVEQPEVLKYVSALADRNDLRRDIKFNTSVTSATWDEADKLWRVETDHGDEITARFLISAAGALSEPNLPDIPGLGDFKGQLYHTGQWPKEPVELNGKRVAVLGTGSTGVQAATAIAKEASHLYVLQRTAQYSLPCYSPQLTDEVRSARKAIYPEHREWQRNSAGGTKMDLDIPFGMKAFDDPKEKRFENYETCWQSGSQALIAVYGDVSTNAEVAAEVSEFVRDKLRATVKDQNVAEKLCPVPGSYLGSRRVIIDTGYYQIFNQPNVTLVDIRNDPIVTFTKNGVKTQGTFHEIDVLVVATGYDAVTGPLITMNITGKHGVKLSDTWSDGLHTHLGLMVAGFPNLFTITGPTSPGVLTNMIYAIDQHVNWIAKCLEHMQATGAIEIDTTQEAQAEWSAHAASKAVNSLRFQDTSNNWYLGTNIPGKIRASLFYQGGLSNYRKWCDQIAADNYRGFVFA